MAHRKWQEFTRSVTLPVTCVGNALKGESGFPLRAKFKSWCSSSGLCPEVWFPNCNRNLYSQNQECTQFPACRPCLLLSFHSGLFYCGPRIQDWDIRKVSDNGGRGWPLSPFVRNQPQPGNHVRSNHLAFLPITFLLCKMSKHPLSLPVTFQRWAREGADTCRGGYNMLHIYGGERSYCSCSLDVAIIRLYCYYPEG